MKRIKISEILIILVLITLSFFVVIPYFHNGYFPTHDGEWAVVRLGDMFRSIKDLQFPTRFSGNLNFGYGYPLFNFAYPFPYYLGLIPYALQFGLVGSIKALFAGSVFLSAIGMYILGKELWKSRLAGFISAVLYIYYPYRMVDLYVRGSIGESLSFALFPLLFFSVLQIAKGKRIRFYMVLGMMLFAAQIMTHNVTSVLFLPFFLAFMALLEKEHHFANWRTYTGMVAGGVMLSMFFWLPALVEKEYIQLSQIPIADRNLYFVSPLQLIIPKFGYGVPIDANGFGYYVGITHVIAFAWIVGMLMYLRRKTHIDVSSYRYTFFFFCASIVYVLLLFKASAPLWQHTPFLREINYPWTILAPLGFVLSLTAGVSAIIPKLRLIAVFFVLVAIITVFPYAKPLEYVDRGDLFYLTNEATTTSSDELMPLWVEQKPTGHFNEKAAIVEGAGSVFDVFAKSNLVTFKTNLAADSIVRVNTIYYPGWVATSNTSAVSIDYENEHGVMDVAVSKGIHAVSLQLRETPLRLFADLVSLTGVLGLVFYILVQGVRRVRSKKIV